MLTCHKVGGRYWVKFLGEELQGTASNGRKSEINKSRVGLISRLWSQAAEICNSKTVLIFKFRSTTLLLVLTKVTSIFKVFYGSKVLNWHHELRT
jgi:hypothetical protein